MSQTVTRPLARTKTDVEFDVELRKVFKVLNGETAVWGVDLQIRQGEFFSILGPSGCGKTTTLRLIAGFEMPSAGEVLILGQLSNQIPAYRRPVNTVFQSYALFNHMNVRENIAFGLRIKKMTNAQIAYEKLPEKLRKNLTLFPPQQVLGKCESIVPLPEEVTQLYDRYWTQLTSG